MAARKNQSEPVPQMERGFSGREQSTASLALGGKLAVASLHTALTLAAVHLMLSDFQTFLQGFTRPDHQSIDPTRSMAKFAANEQRPGVFTAIYAFDF